MKQNGRRRGYGDVSLIQFRRPHQAPPMKPSDSIARPAVGWSQSSILRAGAKASAGLLLLCLLAWGASALLDPNASQRSTPSSSKLSTTSPHGRDYFQSGQWRADARSLAAAFRYLLEDETSENLDTAAAPARAAISAADSQSGDGKKLDALPADHRVRPRG